MTAASRQQAIITFAKRARLLIVFNTVAVITQVMQVCQLMQMSSDPRPRRVCMRSSPVQLFDIYQATTRFTPGSVTNTTTPLFLDRDEMSTNAFAFSVCGVCGSCVTLWGVLMLYSKRPAQPTMEAVALIQYSRGAQPSFCHEARMSSSPPTFKLSASRWSIYSTSPTGYSFFRSVTCATT